MRQNFAVDKTLSLDETLAYVEQIAGALDGMNWQARGVVDPVRKDEGIERDGWVYNNTIEDYARTFSENSNTYGGLMFGITVSLSIPEFHYWNERVQKTKDVVTIPQLEITQNEDLESTIEVANARLFLYEQRGYVAAKMAKRMLARAREEYEGTKVELRDLLIEAAEHFVSHREELDPAIVHTE